MLSNKIASLLLMAFAAATAMAQVVSPIEIKDTELRSLQQQYGTHYDLSTDNLHMNDEGYRHLAEHVVGIIIKSLLPSAKSNTAAARH